METITLRKIDKSHQAKSEWLRERIQNASQCIVTRLFLVMEDETEVALVSLDLHRSQGILVVYNIFVEPSYRRRGIARQILRKSEAMARNLGFTQIQLKPKPLEETVSLDDLVRFYASEGYRWMSKGDQMEKPIRRS
jgi:GNAT superfamily N-acetyltransferase